VSVFVCDLSNTLCDRANERRFIVRLKFSTRHDEIFEQAQQLQSYDKTDQVGFMIYIIMAFACLFLILYFLLYFSG
jgi:hypothetical protein